ncbi:endonuclease [Vibrio hannami]|uniref:endonuclease III domain-containing protein n=1 Tax=Vibrio hannami TaxID=2717094 RepID=UPI00240EDBD5|nr:endonuclease [Vibrio hannami]MDG3085876.1 endonuclease [Vibrio hannami]
MKPNKISTEQRTIIESVVVDLSAHYGPFNWWQSDSPFEVMVGAILVQNTAWANVEKALDKLGQELTPELMQEMPLSELAEKIRSSGYYNQKAQKLKALIQWYREYNFDIETVRIKSTTELREELLSIKGIGNETADAILVYAIKKPSFIIDAYTRRIFTRIGLDVPKNYEAFQAMFEQVYSKDTTLYAYYHGLMVEHAQQFCRKTPLCSGCPLFERCLGPDIK